MPDILSEFLKLIGGVAAIGAVSCAFAYATFRSRSPRETCRTIRLVFFFQHASVIDVEAIEEIVALTNQTVYANQPAQRQVGARDKAWFALDSPLEGDGFELVWGFSCQVVVFGFCRFFVRSWKAVLRSLIAPQVSRGFCPLPA